MISKVFVRHGATAAVAIALMAGAASAAVTLHYDLAAYTGAGGNDGITVDFDSTDPGTNIDSATLNGVQFGRLGSPLIVVTGASTYTNDGVFALTNNPANNVLIPTTGNNVLSPGGSELGLSPDLEYDSFEMSFATPVPSVGFDLLYQSLDGFSFVAMSAYDIDGNKIFNDGGVYAGSSFDGNAAGVQFYGLVSDGALIARVVIDEYDNDNNVFPDANIGIDTVRTGVPAPGAAGVLGMGLLVGARRRR